jgi:hypothetical protein
MDDVLCRALEGIAAAESAKPPPGPIVLSEEYLRLVERVEEHPANRPGTDKTWTERALLEWVYLLKTRRLIPPG